MSKNNAKGLTTLRQRVRRYIRDNLEAEIAAYKENPDDGESEEGKKNYQLKIKSISRVIAQSLYKQECIPVGCVPSAAVAVSGGGLPRG